MFARELLGFRLREQVRRQSGTVAIGTRLRATPEVESSVSAPQKKISVFDPA